MKRSKNKINRGTFLIIMGVTIAVVAMFFDTFWINNLLANPQEIKADYVKTAGKITRLNENKYTKKDRYQSAIFDADAKNAYYFIYEFKDSKGKTWEYGSRQFYPNLKENDVFEVYYMEDNPREHITGIQVYFYNLILNVSLYLFYIVLIAGIITTIIGAVVTHNNYERRMRN